MQADTNNEDKYGRSSAGSKGFYILSVISPNKLKLSGDISIPNYALSNLWSISLGNALNAQFSTISSVDIENGIVTFSSNYDSSI